MFTRHDMHYGLPQYLSLKGRENLHECKAPHTYYIKVGLSKQLTKLGHFLAQTICTQRRIVPEICAQLTQPFWRIKGTNKETRTDRQTH